MADNVQVMVLGKPGIGKSTLANGLMGRDEAPINPPGSVETKGVTRAVESYEFTHNGVRSVIWDTPGLLDSTLNQDTVLRDIMKIYHDIDLFLLCIRMPDGRLIKDDDNHKIIEILENKFGKDIWSKTLVVLVFANELVASLKIHLSKNGEVDMEEVKATFYSNEQQWTSLMKQKLGESYLGVVPTGHINRPKILETDGERWLNKFWEKCLRSLPTPEKQAALLKLNEDRLTNNPDVSIEKKSLAQQRIFASHSLKEFFSVLAERFSDQLVSLKQFLVG